jgi:hypothetical protein
MNPHPLFVAFVKAAKNYNQQLVKTHEEELQR